PMPSPWHLRTSLPLQKVPSGWQSTHVKVPCAQNFPALPQAFTVVHAALPCASGLHSSTESVQRLSPRVQAGAAGPSVASGSTQRVDTSKLQLAHSPSA